MDDESFTVYPSRWVILLSVSLLNIANAIVTTTYFVYHSEVTRFFQNCSSNVSEYVEILEVSALMTPFVLGIFIIYLISKFGLRFAILLGAFLNASGSALKLVGTLKGDCGMFAMNSAGEIVAALAKPFISYIPTTLSAVWFPESQRALATALGTIAYPVGIICTRLIPPTSTFIDPNTSRTWQQRDIFLVNTIGCAASVFTFLIALCFVRSSKPPSVPNDSAKIRVSLSMRVVLKEFRTNIPLLVLTICVGCQVAIFTFLFIKIEDVLCLNNLPWDYVLLCELLFIVFGISSSALVTYMAAKRKQTTDARKIAIGITCFVISFFPMVTKYLPEVFPLFVIMCFLIGCFAFPAYALGLELGDESAFTVFPEVASMGFIMLFGQLFTLIYKYVFWGLSRSYKGIPKDTCSIYIESLSFLTVPFLIIVAVQVGAGLVFVTRFQPELRRTRAEMIARMERILDIDSSTEISVSGP